MVKKKIDYQYIVSCSKDMLFNRLFFHKILRKTKRPDLNLKVAESALLDFYGISALLSELPSERDQNFYCFAEKEYVLEISNASEDPDFLDFQNEALQHLSKKGIDKPQLYKSKNNQNMVAVTFRDTHFVSLVSYSPGKVFAKVNPHSDYILTKFGRYLGEMDRALADFKHPQMHREFHWDLKYATSVINQHSTHLTHDSDLVEYFKNLFDEIPLEKLRQQVIHNDSVGYHQDQYQLRHQQMFSIQIEQ
ncbi:MAG: phosphotransferase [Candidatus Heimdallarchaeota archaeon]|nr:phosphotransferase [Candidatus Heimdallarchaeota archaeon]